MKESEPSSMVEEYTEIRPVYEAYTNKIEELIKSLLEKSDIPVHSVTSRTKDTDSFSKKLKEKGKGYKIFSDVTDLSGVRIICYFAGQVDEVAEIIKSNFIIHHELSIDKRKTLDPDRFGYLSLHHVVELSEDRARLPEYERFKILLCEVQIRSILQHAWAEIEHDLGYKAPIEVPRESRRRFCRLASLLELADDEFDGIKKDIASYSERVASHILSAPEKILIDKVSLGQYLKNSPTLEEIAKAIADYIESEVIEEISLRPIDIEGLRYFNILTIDELDKVFKKNKEEIIAFGKEWLSGKGEIFVDMSIPLFILYYVMVGSTRDYDAVMKFLKFAFAKIAEEDPSHLAKLTKKIIGIYKKIAS